MLSLMPQGVGRAALSTVVLLTLLAAGPALAHGIGGKDAAFVAGTTGPDIVPFLYLAPSTW